jgi:hypothetical protein
MKLRIEVEIKNPEDVTDAIRAHVGKLSDSAKRRLAIKLEDIVDQAAALAALAWVDAEEMAIVYLVAATLTAEIVE